MPNTAIIVMRKFIVYSVMHVFIHSIHTRIRETGRPFNRHKTKLNAISSQDAPLAADPRSRRRVPGGGGGSRKPPGNCAITRRARTTRQSQLLLTDIRLMIVCAAHKRPNVSWTSASARDYGVCVIAAFVWYSSGAHRWMYRFGVRICGKTSARSARRRGGGGDVLAEWVSSLDDLWRG